MRAEVKKLLRESRKNYFCSIDNNFKDNPKRFWTVLKQKSKSCSVPDHISMPSPSSENVAHSDFCSRSTATTPTEIATFFNTYFSSVFTSENLSDEPRQETNHPILTKLVLTEIEVESILKYATHKMAAIVNNNAVKASHDLIT